MGPPYPTGRRMTHRVESARRRRGCAGRLRGTKRGVATTLRDTHDHSLVTDLLGVILGVAVAVLLIVATLTAAGIVVVRWANGV